ncbi:MAG TPA: SIS domain-containing protein [Pyrinomonadaceae bacterium]|jgi:D-sedoheptulose 7-phosphate isomerase|nr:SIS domain-containing protein [Pyrinomonadaceae bacterium]
METGLIASHFDANREVVGRSGELLREPAQEVARSLVEALREGHKVIAFGNGGSATQASHLVGELLGRFKLTRQPFPAIALASDAGTVTCIANDFSYAELFERQVEALAQPGDICFGFTTSGRSENVRRGLEKARERGAVTVAVTGSAGLVGGEADYVIAVPSDVTAHVQEVHLMLLHVWCIYVDEQLGRAQ